jgi:hypothetical protein
MTEFWNLIQIGSVYLTDTEGSTGDKAMATVQGMDKFGIAQLAQQTKAIDGRVYTQFQAIIDAPVTIDVPKMESELYDAVRDVFTAWIATPTDFTFAVTGVPENFTGTAKPRWETGEPPISYTGERVDTQIWGVTIRLWVTD